VTLGDGDDSLTSPFTGATVVSAGDGNDVVDSPSARVDGGAGDDALTANTVRGGPGADVLTAQRLEFGELAAGVTVDLAAGTAVSAGVVDRLAPGVLMVFTGRGNDVVRAVVAGSADYGVIVGTGYGDDVIEGSPLQDQLDGGPGADVIRGHGGGDTLGGGFGDDRLEGGDGDDWLAAQAGDDVLDGNAGNDTLAGGPGADRLLARDGRHDRANCADEDRASGAFEGDRATLDALDGSSWCEHIDRTGRGRLELHGFTRTGAQWARMVVSCGAQRACSATLRVFGGVADAKRLRVPAGRRTRVPIRLRQPRGRVSVRLVTPTNVVLRATLDAARR
jgi:Ca2+-binding RTX toxin-like protein